MNRFLFLLVPFLFSINAFADYSTEMDLSVENREVMYIELSSDRLEIGEITPDMKEVVKLKGIKLKVKSNVKWALTVEPQGNLISLSGDEIPIERFSVRYLKGKYTPLSLAEPLAVASGEPTKNDGFEIDMDFKINVNWDDPAGIYNTKLKFTLNSLY